MKLLEPINKLLFSLGRKKNNPNFLGNILVVSSTGFGDTLLSTPAIKTLRKSFSNNKLIFLVNKKFSTLFINYHYVDFIWEYTGNYFNLFYIIFKCRAQNINTIFLFHSNSPEDIFITLLSGAENIHKWTDNTNHQYKSLFVNKANIKKQHHIEKKIDLVRFFKPKIIDTSMTISDEFHHSDSFVYQSNNKKIIGIQLGAQDRYKIWPVENIIKLSKILIRKDFFLVFFGETNFELEMMNLINKSLDLNSILNLNRKTKIEELPKMIKGLDLLISNDTGILHLAIAMKIKTLSLFGPTSSKEFGAYQDQNLHHSIQKNGFFVNDKPKKNRTQDGMKLISVDEVIFKLEEMI